MNKIVLHIGTEKTGTTAIQECIHANRDRLLTRFGIFVPSAYARYNNHRCFMEIVPGLNAPQDDLYGELSSAIGIMFDPQRQRREWLQDFEADTAQYPDKCFLLSSEQFHSRLITQEAAEKFLEHIAAYFSEIRLVVFLRDPFSGAEAMRSTLVVNGHCVPEPLEPDDDRVQMLSSHASTLQRWDRALARSGFERTSLEPQIYAPEEFPGRCAARNFVRLLGIDEPDEFTFPAQRVNESLGGRELDLLSHFNRLPAVAGEERSSLAQARELLSKIKQVDSSSHQQSPRDALGLATRFDDFYRTSNEWVHRNFFQDRPVLFNEKNARREGNRLDLAEDIFQTLSACQSRSGLILCLRELVESTSARHEIDS